MTQQGLADVANEPKVYWEYQVESDDGWCFAHAAGQRPHHYATREEMMKILGIIHPGEKVRLLRMEEMVVPKS